MSKGVIVQMGEKAAHILKNDGGFVSCPPDKNWRVGDVVTLTRRRRPYVRAFAISVAALVFLTLGAGVVAYQTPAAYLEVSVNPSVQFSVNRFDRVLDVVGLNEDGKELLRESSFQWMSFREANGWLMDKMKNEGVLGEGVLQFIIAGSSQRKVDQMERELRENIEKFEEAEGWKISVKRYTNKEYLELEHPLPIQEIPETQEQDASVGGGSHGSGGFHHGGNRDGWWDWDCGKE